MRARNTYTQVTPLKTQDKNGTAFFEVSAEDGTNVELALADMVASVVFGEQRHLIDVITFVVSIMINCACSY